MGGKGNFSDPRIGLFIKQTPDLVTPKLRALLDYQLSLRPPRAPRGSLDEAAADAASGCFVARLNAPVATRGRTSPTC